MAKELTRNTFSDNYMFILTEIKDSEENFHIQRRLRKKENDRKTPLTLEELSPTIQRLCDNLYDLNLYIYKATKNMTTIEIRYYPKTSLDKDYRSKVINNPPMLHCKVSMPPWLTEKKEKFDINWEHNTGWNRWKMFWLKLRLKIQIANICY